MNKKQRQEIKDKLVGMLLYLCDKEIKNQWKTCEAYADIIIGDIMECLMVDEFRRGYNKCLKDQKLTGEKYQNLYL